MVDGEHTEHGEVGSGVDGGVTLHIHMYAERRVGAVEINSERHDDRGRCLCLCLCSLSLSLYGSHTRSDSTNYGARCEASGKDLLQ